MNFRSRGNLYIAKMMKTTGERPAEKIAGGRKEYRQGMTSALMCSFFWGILPIYWQLLRPIDSSVIIFYRIVLVAAVSLTGALLFHSREEISAPLKDKKLVAKYALAGLLITVNWSIYIWAVNADFVIQTSIGYYIEPLVVCVFGIVLFKEKLSKYKMIALVFAAAGVAAVIAYFREIPLIALGLALTFAVYAAAKKNFSLPPIISLFYETVFLVPIALGVIIYLEVSGKGALSVGDPFKFALLMLCGLFTALPLGLFANAARKLNLFVVGLTEYISPTLSLFIGIFLFKEPFESIQLVAFAIIWVGLIFFSYGEYRESRERHSTDCCGGEEKLSEERK